MSNRRRSGGVSLLLATTLFVLGCSSSPAASGTVDASGVDIGLDIPTCGPGQSYCPGAGGAVGICASTLLDPHNCGICGHVCNAGQLCVSGMCQLTCAPGQIACAVQTASGDGGVIPTTDLGSELGGTPTSEQCVMLATDNANCGACGHSCAPGQFCSNGLCAIECGASERTCTPSTGLPYCADVTRDPANCGACGHLCPAGEMCISGACVTSCPLGQTVCPGVASADGGMTAGYCASLQADLNNCGTCGHVCPSGQACSMGTCAVSCAAGLTICTGLCTNVQTDLANCGTCGHACPSGQVCEMGSCAVSCAVGLSLCSGLCTSVQSDRANCGACGHACPSGNVCTSGMCVISCPAAETLCGGLCRDLTTDQANCGTCGHACGSGQVCAMSVCVVSCVAGETNCGGSCHDLTSDVTDCGTCGTVCPSGARCIASACVTPHHASYVFVPGPASAFVYSPTANALRLSLDVGAPTPTILPGMTFTGAGVQVATITGTGLLRIDGDQPFQAWVNDGNGGDKINAAGALDGTYLNTELYTWAAGNLSVYTLAVAPSAVTVEQIPPTGVPVLVDTWTAPTANGYHAFVTPTSAVYRVTSVGSPVTAFGQVLSETYNHFAYVPADNGTLSGTSFRYAEPAGAPGVRHMIVQALEASADVAFTVGGTVNPTVTVTPSVATRMVFPADTLVTATSSTSAIAWIEADPGSACDGTLLDADLVPSIRGLTFDTDWVFRTSLVNGTCYSDRRSDIDVIGFTDGTVVQRFDALTATTPVSTVTVNRGQRVRLITDAASDLYVRVATSHSALVEHSHAPYQFAIRAPSITTY